MTIARQGLPLVGVLLLQFSVQFTDAVMVGRLGAGPLSSLALGAHTYTVFSIFCLGIVSAISPLVAESRGQGNVARGGQFAAIGLVLGLVASIMVVLPMVESERLFLFLGQPRDVAVGGGVYLEIMAWGIPGFTVVGLMRNGFEGLAQTRSLFVIAVCGTLLNVLLDYLFIFGVGGFPKGGIAGAAWASVLVYWMMAFALLVLMGRPKFREFGFWQAFGGLSSRAWRAVYEDATKIVKIGLPLSLIWAGEVGFFTSTTYVVGKFASAEMASHMIAINAASFVFMIPMGMSFAVTARIGFHVGKKDRMSRQQASIAGYSLGVLIALSSAVLFMFFPEWVIRCYTTDQSLIEDSTRLVRVAGFFQLFDAFQVTGLAILRGMKDTRVPLVGSLVGFWGIALPLVFWGAQRQGAIGVWYGILVGLGFVALFYLLRLAVLNRRRSW